MMGYEIPQNQGATVEYYPPVVPASVSARLLDSSGAVLQTSTAVTVAVDDVDTTLASVTDRETLAVEDGTGLIPGRSYWLVSQQTSERRALVTIDSLTEAESVGAPTRLDIYPGPQWLPVAGDAFVGARCTFAISSTSTGTRDPNCAIEWTVTDAAGGVTLYRTPVAIVRMQFYTATRPEDVRAYLASRYASRANELDADPTRYSQIAERATLLVQRRIRESARWPHMVGDPNAFLECKRLALRVALLDDGIRDGVDDVTTYTDALIRRLDDETRRACASMQYDADDSGSLDATETRQYWIPLRRG